MATHSSRLAWKIPWTEEPGGLQSLGSKRIRHNCQSTRAHLHGALKMLGAEICNFFFSWSFFKVSSGSQKFFHIYKIVKEVAYRLIQSSDSLNAS